MMRKNLASLSAALAAAALLMSAASSWATDAPQSTPQAVPLASVPAPAVQAQPAPIRLAWDRVGISAFSFGV